MTRLEQLHASGPRGENACTGIPLYAGDAGGAACMNRSSDACTSRGREDCMQKSTSESACGVRFCPSCTLSQLLSRADRELAAATLRFELAAGMMYLPGELLREAQAAPQANPAQLELMS